MQKTALTLALLTGVALVSSNAFANDVASRTETTYTKQNEVIMDGYTPLDVIDNSVKTSVRTYRNPNVQPAPQPRPYSIPAPQQQAYAPQVVQPQAPSYAPAQGAYVQQGAIPPLPPLQNTAATVNGHPVYTSEGNRVNYVVPRALPQPAVQPQPVPQGVNCVMGQNCPSKVTSIEYSQSPVKVQYPVVRQYPVSIEYPVTVNRDVTVRQPVIVEQPVVLQKPVVVNQPVMVERAPAYIRQQAVRMQQQPSYVQQQQVTVQAPAGQVLPPCANGNCR